MDTSSQYKQTLQTAFIAFITKTRSTGKTGSIDHPSPERAFLCKRQNTNTFTLSTGIGMKWSGGPFFPTEHPIQKRNEHMIPEMIEHPNPGYNYH